MTDLGTASTVQTAGSGYGAHAADPAEHTESAGVGAAAAYPALLKAPTFVIGSVALGLYLMGAPVNPTRGCPRTQRSR